MSSGDHDCLPLEAQLEQIRQWFKTYVDARFPGAEARCLPNTHKSSLSGIIPRVSVESQGGLAWRQHRSRTDQMRSVRLSAIAGLRRCQRSSD